MEFVREYIRNKIYGLPEDCCVDLLKKERVVIRDNEYMLPRVIQKNFFLIV